MASLGALLALNIHVLTYLKLSDPYACGFLGRLNYKVMID